MLNDKKNNNYEEYDPHMIENITNDIIKIFSSDKENLTKNESKILLNLIYETIFNEKLQNKNFEHIFSLLSVNNKIQKDKISILTKSLIISFDINYIKNSSSFNNKICIKLDKNSLPTNYYIKKN